MSKKVFVGLSGGVDSAVSAALLKEKGYDVTGAFIKIWQPEFFECTWEKDRLDALRVCVALDIPFREVDMSDVYKREVISDLIDGYRKGVTPNPDVLCNRKIKFGTFSSWAFEQGADVVATGHYARIRETDGAYSLLRGVDSGKDQSYFLWQLQQTDLDRTLFPVGELQKSEVREYARTLNLPVAQKKDSQGLCFVGDVTMAEFLSRYIPLSSGALLDEEGRAIGTHSGASLYTVGQRHGFVVNGHSALEPHFVVKTDSSANTVTVSSVRCSAESQAVSIDAVSWVGNAPELPLSCTVQTRYRETPVPAILQNGTTVGFSRPSIAASGQSLVFYDGERLLGGGIIKKKM